MTLYSPIYLEYGTGGIIFGSNTFGGVNINIRTETFEEEDSEYVNKEYMPVKGKFNLYLTGPTASGVRHFVDLIKDYATLPERYYADQAPYPLLFHIGDRTAILRKMTVTMWDKHIQLDDLKAIELEISYEREGLLGNSLSYPDLSNTTTATITSKYPITTTNYDTFIPSPINMQLALGNQGSVFPSGIFLTSNARIMAISGGYFYRTGSFTGHTTQNVIDEDRWFAFSTYNGAQNNHGVLRTVPTALNTSIISSGVIYGNNRTSLGLGTLTVGQRSVDVYATYRTTFSGTLFDLNLIADWQDITNVGKTAQTGYKRLPHTLTPNTEYIGRINGNIIIDYARLRLDIVANNAISGALLIDKIVLHPVDETNTSIFISKLQLPSVNPSSSDGADPSGVIIAEFLNSYVNNASTYRPPRAALRVFRPGKSSKVPNYRGDINIFTKRLDITFPNGISDATVDSGLFSFYYIMKGSTYDTVSGMNLWQHVDRHNTITKINYQIANDIMRTSI